MKNVYSTRVRQAVFRIPSARPAVDAHFLEIRPDSQHRCLVKARGIENSAVYGHYGSPSADGRVESEHHTGQNRTEKLEEHGFQHHAKLKGEKNVDSLQYYRIWLETAANKYIRSTNCLPVEISFPKRER